MFEEKVVSLNSPSLFPSPVKSKRKVAMLSLASAREMRLAAMTSFEQVKQWANIAYARGCSSLALGSSMIAERVWLSEPVKVTLVEGMWGFLKVFVADESAG